MCLIVLHLFQSNKPDAYCNMSGITRKKENSELKYRYSQKSCMKGNNYVKFCRKVNSYVQSNNCPKKRE